MVRADERQLPLGLRIETSFSRESADLEEEHEDPWKSLGYVDPDDTTTRLIEEQLSRGLGTTGSNLGVLEKAIRAGLRYFPLSGKERIFSPERAIELLDGIGDTGFPLDPYNTLNPEELWIYANGTKNALRNLGSSRCPQVLRDVDIEYAEHLLH